MSLGGIPNSILRVERKSGREGGREGDKTMCCSLSTESSSLRVEEIKEIMDRKWGSGVVRTKRGSRITIAIVCVGDVKQVHRRRSQIWADQGWSIHPSMLTREDKKGDEKGTLTI